MKIGDKMNEYENDGEYTDGTEKRPKIVLIIGALLIISIIIALIAVSCDKKSKKNDNNYLGYIKVNSGVITPNFNKEVLNYEITTETDTLVLSCVSENSKAIVQGCNETIKVDENTKIYQIKIKAENGNERVYNFNIKKDSPIKMQPQLNIEGTVKSGDKSVNNVKLTAKIINGSDNYQYQWYKDSKKIENAITNVYTVSTSGNYTVEAISKTDNKKIVSKEYVVAIEKAKNESSNYTLKINKVEGNPTTWKTSATIKVSASASNGIKSFSFDGGKTCQTSSSKKITKNTTLVIMVKDKKNNTISKSIKITKIDTIKPTLKIKVVNEYSSKSDINVSINPTKTASGYKYQWYKNGNLIKGATEKTITVSSSGKYTVKVKTGAGNISETSYNYILPKEALTCPVLTATKYPTTVIATPEQWFEGKLRLQIVPSKATVKYEVYCNRQGSFDKINYNFTLNDLYTSPTAIVITGTGKRLTKIVIYDKFDNKKDCYSKIYYLGKNN